MAPEIVVKGTTVSKIAVSGSISETHTWPSSTYYLMLNNFLFFNTTITFFTVQTCSRVDVAFLIDSSGSLGHRNYRRLLGAVNTLAEHLNIGPMQSHAAVVVFSDKVENPITFNDYLTLDEFKAKVLNLPFMSQRTRIDLALDMALNKVFTKEGNTRHFVPKIAILLTDGVQTRTRDQIPLTTVAGNLINKGVHLYAVGIGRGVNRAQLELLVKKKHHVVEIKSFRSLETTIVDIGKHVCSNIPGECINTGVLESDVILKCNFHCSVNRNNNSLMSSPI